MPPEVHTEPIGGVFVLRGAMRQTAVEENNISRLKGAYDWRSRFSRKYNKQPYLPECHVSPFVCLE